MKKFINLSPEESTDLDKVIYKNAIQLKKDSKILAKQNTSYGTAVSLLILSSEEIIKAILVLLHSKNYDVYKLQSSRKFFLDHKIRHNIAQIIELGNGFLEAFEKLKEEKPKVKSFKKKSYLSSLLILIKASQPLLQSKNRIEEMQNFNSLKNEGLYVDYLDGIKIPKEIFTKLQYLRIEKIVLRIFRFYKILRISYHPNLEFHMNKNRVLEYHKELHFFINDALEDFSFKKF